MLCERTINPFSKSTSRPHKDSSKPLAQIAFSYPVTRLLRGTLVVLRLLNGTPHSTTGSPVLSSLLVLVVCICIFCCTQVDDNEDT